MPNKRGRPKAVHPRRFAVQVLLTSQERMTVHQAAEVTGMSVSAWLRRMAMDNAHAILDKQEEKVPESDGPTGVDYFCDKCRRLEACYCPP